MKKFAKILRTLCLLTVLGVAGLSLTACDEAEVSDPAHTIYFYNSMGKNFTDALNASIADFEAKFPGWTVKSVQPGGYDEIKSSIITDLQGGSQPDLAYCYPDHVAEYLVTGKVVNMSQYINSTAPLTVNVLNAETGAYEPKTYENEIVGYSAEEIADFIEEFWKEGYAAGYPDYQTYGYKADDLLTLPFQRSTEALYYNATAFIELGLYTEVDVEKEKEDGTTEIVKEKVAKVPTTWDELWEVCRLAKAKWPTVTPLGYDSESNWFINMCQQNGWGYTSADKDNHYLFRNAQTEAWLNQLADYYAKGYFTTKELYGTYTSNLFKLGTNGGTIMSIGSTGGASNQKLSKDKWGVAAIPGSLVDGKINASVISQGPSLVMFNTSADNATEKQAMTWEYVKMLLDPVNQTGFAGVSGYMTVRKSSYDVPKYAEDLSDKENISAVTCNLAVSIKDRCFTSPAFKGSSTARDQVGVALRYVVTGKKTAAAALFDAAKKCGAKLS